MLSLAERRIRPQEVAKDVLDAIPKDLHEPSQTKLLSDDSSTTQHPKALGMYWDASNDVFFVSTGTFTHQITTKRSIVSDIARTFDVHGWLAPATVTMKILFQKLWELRLEWDEEVPPHIQQQHLLWRKKLSLFKDFPFQRCYFRTGAQTLHTELHGFADASENAYADVVYLRTTYTPGPPSMSLVAAKTKVAPLKKQSIPRLELCSAQLLAKFITNVRQALKIDLSCVHAWSDSTIVLHWLDGSPRCFKTLVGTRVATILELLPVYTWKHVPTQDNLADYACCLEN